MTRPKTSTTFDWSALHAILEALPEGCWTTCGSLADAVGTAPVPLGQHVASGQQCANAYRVLYSGGTVAENFRWSDPQETRSPEEVLQVEGAVVDGRGIPSRELSSDDLQALIVDKRRAVLQIWRVTVKGGLKREAG